MNQKLPTLILCSLLLSACGGEPSKPPGGNPAKGETPMDDHGTAHSLGKVTLGTIPMTVTQFGDIEAGHEAAFDVEVADVAGLPGTVRAWIGVETGVGSRKGKLDKLIGKLHGHVDVPDPIPEGSKLWLELDLDAGTVRASIGLHR